MSGQFLTGVQFDRIQKKAQLGVSWASLADGINLLVKIIYKYVSYTTTMIPYNSDGILKFQIPTSF